MKRSIKITSALLVLVLLLAQVVCVSAATQYTPSISISLKQTDHYIKTATAKVTGDTVNYIWLRAYDSAGALQDEQATAVAEGTQVTLSMEVRPSKIAKVEAIVSYQDKDGNAKKATKSVNVGSNSYYNPGSTSNSRYDEDDFWDGIKNNSSSSSGKRPSYSSSEETNIWEYVPDSKPSKPSYNTWNGYYDNDLTDTYFVTARTLNVRAGDGTNYAKVGSLHRGDAVEVYDIEDGWAVIDYFGRLRYVSANYLTR